MSINITKNNQVLSLSLDTDNHTLRTKCANDVGNAVDSEIDLNGYIENVNGKFSWGGLGNFSLTAKDVKLEGSTLTAILTHRDGTPTQHHQTLELAEKLYNINGKLVFLPDGPDPEPTQAPNLQLDGNIVGQGFAVASDGPRNRCRIAYRTVFDEKISFAEVEFDGSYWGLSTEIKLYKGKVPGQNIAFTFDPIDPQKRSLFFSEENGNGYIYQQHYNPKIQKWDTPAVVKQSSEPALDGKRAHRFSKFAAAYYNDDTTKKSAILLYCVDENSNLTEYRGTHSDANDPNSYYWTSQTDFVGDTVPSNTFLAVTQSGNKTLLTYRDNVGNLCLSVGVRDSQKLKCTWDDSVILLAANELMKNSPLAIVSRGKNNPYTVFFAKRDGYVKTIYSLDYLPGMTFVPKRVGKLQSDSVIGAASFPTNSMCSARLFNVSNLDGDSILLERVPKFFAAKNGGQMWVISGGLVDTDTDHLEPQT